MTTKTKFSALGAHIYAGGFTLGVKAAGFQVLGHLEEWEFGVETVRKNLKLPVRVGVEAWRSHEFKRKVDYFYVNPPCASWSEAGRKVNNKETRNVDRYKHDGRTKCTELCFEQIPVIEPKVFTWESVAAATTNGKAFVQDRVKFMNALGYHVYLLLFTGPTAVCRKRADASSSWRRRCGWSPPLRTCRGRRRTRCGRASCAAIRAPVPRGRRSGPSCRR
jgi:hypothetical protein